MLEFNHAKLTVQKVEHMCDDDGVRLLYEGNILVLPRVFFIDPFKEQVLTHKESQLYPVNFSTCHLDMSNFSTDKMINYIQDCVGHTFPGTELIDIEYIGSSSVSTIVETSQIVGFPIAGIVIVYYAGFCTSTKEIGTRVSFDSIDAEADIKEALHDLYRRRSDEAKFAYNRNAKSERNRRQV